MERGLCQKTRRGLEANDVYWLKVSLLLCSEASADCPHNFRAILHWVILSDTDLDCIWFKTGLDTVQNKFWQT